MSDIYIPGIKSRFNSEQIIEDLMKVERVPRDRAETNVNRLESEKTYWTDVGKRMTGLRDSARSLYSFQNPFNDRIVRSSDEAALTASAVREAIEQERSFTVKQIAQADRFLSAPLDDSYRIDSGTYTFSVDKSEVSFSFRGGTLREFVDAFNRRGQDKIQASLIAVKPGTKSLLIESRITGADNRLHFSKDAEILGQKIGMVEPAYDSRQSVEGNFTAKAGENTTIPVYPGIASAPNLVLKFETSTVIRPAETWVPPKPPPGPAIPSAGSISYGGIVIENTPSAVTLPPWTPPEAPKRVDDMNIINLNFSDGTSRALPALADSASYNVNQYNLGELAPGKTIVSIDLINNNTHRDVSVRNIQVFDPQSVGGIRPLNAVSTAQDAIISMEGIEIQRPKNSIDDLIPGLTLNLKAPSDRPINIKVEPDREGVKNALISLVGNYNRLMAEINILTARSLPSGLGTRVDDSIIDELTYLTKEERDEYKTRLGAFQADSTLGQYKSMLQRTVTSPYPTSLERDLALLSQIGIGSDVGRSGASTGYSASRLRGYLEIDEKALDAAIASKLPAIKELFGYDTSGDLLVDTGIAFNLEKMTRPYVETGGLIALKTSSVDSRISQEQRRIDTMDRQLAAKERELKIQYGQMESAYSRMEQMSTSLDRFSQQNSNSNNNR